MTPLVENSYLVHLTESFGEVDAAATSKAESFVRHLLWGIHRECCGNPQFDSNSLGGERCCGRPEVTDLNDAQIVGSLRAMFPERKSEAAVKDVAEALQTNDQNRNLE